MSTPLPLASVSISDAAAQPIASAQCTSDGLPRFVVPAVEHPAWAFAAEVESYGGVSADVRAFLDLQLETGDVFVDLDPGFGFVALAAATSSGGFPTVFVAGLSDERTQALQDAAASAGAWLDPLDWQHEVDVAALLDGRLDTGGRVIVHATAADLPNVITRLQPLLSTGRILALCISDALEAHVDGAGASSEWAAALAAVRDADMTCMALHERDGELLLVRMDEQAIAGAVFALPSDAVPVGPADEVLDCEIFPASHESGGLPVASSESISAASLQGWHAQRDGISFIAPHSRTGYGVAGAHLLRALQEQHVPVAFFPLGPVDGSLTSNPALRDALDAQGTYRDSAPSVRLAQQFDLAMHVGRGPRIAFTIFELDAFSERERHHLSQQDAIIVCTDWARQVCLENGMTNRPIHVVPLGVDRAVFNEQVVGSPRGADTVFLQVGKLEPRKGQRELLRAFEAAFTPRDAVRLVLACHNPFAARADADRMQRPFLQSRMASRITMHTSELSTSGDVAALMASADCGVFAARAEGWNLEALEMLSMGKPLIATACTAHNAYLGADNARLIDIDSLEAAAGAPRGRWAAWGESQHEQLVAHLRAVHAEKQNGALTQNDTGIATAQRLSWTNAAESLCSAISTIA